jgi:hypothetical protein
MPAAAAKTQPALAERFKAAHAEVCELAEAVISERVRLEKLAHPGLPEVNIEMMIRKHRPCSCLVALEVLEKYS